MMSKSRIESAIGQPVKRVDGIAKVTGQALYTGDVILPGMLFGKCLRSPHPSARIVSIDTSRAAALPGVHAILTAADVPETLYGRTIRDIPILARGRVHFMGEKVAAVAAESAAIAEAALELIDVEYEELPAVFDVMEAMAPGAPIVHPQPATTYPNPGIGLHGELRMFPDIPNVMSQLLVRHGDAAAAMAGAAHVFEHTFSVPGIHQGYLEPHSCVVSVGADGIVDVWASNKSPFIASKIVGDTIGIPVDRIRFNPVMIGGDFGGKGSVMDTILCYYLAARSRRPVRMVMTYEEELTAGNPRHPATITLRTGLDEAANIVAMEGKLAYNSGAYGGFIPVATLVSFHKFAGTYRVPNCTLDVRRVYTNNLPSGHMRSPGSPQLNFAQESHIDMIAAALGIDPLALRRRNAIQPGDLSPIGESRPELRCVETIEAGARAFDWDAKRPPNVGRGVALYEFPPATFGPSNVTLSMKQDGRVSVMVGAGDTGTGFHTIVGQLVAGQLGIPMEEVEVVYGDTLTAGFEVGGSGARLTITISQAVREATGRMNEALAALASERLNCAPADVIIDEQGRFSAGGAAIDRRALMGWAAERGKAPLACKGMNIPNKPDDITSFAAQFAEVEVDRETGQVRVLRIVTAHDVHTIINPITHQGQIEGGVIQAFGQAMSERLVTQNGIVITPHLGEYKLPTIMDIPELETVLVPSETAGLSDPRAIGEVSNVAICAAIANAVHDAVGVRLLDLPISAEKIFNALNEPAGTA